MKIISKNAPPHGTIGSVHYVNDTLLVGDDTIKPSANDTQVGGTHYYKMNIQPIDFIYANNIPFMEANVIKYVCRHDSKNGLQDLEKAKHYIDLLIEKKYKTK
jgi:hypothetical protein